MKDNFEDQLPPRSHTAMQLTKLYRGLEAELDGLEATKERRGTCAQHIAKHVAQSRKICKHLRKLAHALISSEDEGRFQFGNALQNDILQMIVGINIRLLNLDRDISIEGEAFKREVAMLQQMVKESSDLLSGRSDRKTPSA